ncbi:MAG: NlpC/P60 family protein [Lachnospiraceae bacterium]
MRKLQRRAKAVLALVLVVSLTIGSSQVVYATSAQNKKSEAEKNLNDVNKKIDNLENKKEEIEGELDTKNEELVNLMVDVGILEKEIDQNEKQLKQVKKDLKTAQKNEKKQYQAMKKRIKFMYERGDSAVISSLLESKSMADMLNRVEYFNEVYDYDRNLLDNYEKTRKQVEDLKAQVEDEKKELETAQDDLKQQQKQLETAMANLRSQQANADTQIANAKSLASEYQKTITEQNKIIQQQQAAAAASGRSSGGSSGGSGGTSKPNSNASVPGGNLNPPKTTNVSGSDVVNYAMQFVGKPYVWGGKDPNTGADCSGFTSYVYAHFGISIPSFSGAQRSCGQEVSYANAQAGDLICYAGHVAIYMGGGKIVHAKGTAYGIVGNDNATYKTIITVRRLL